MGLANCSVICPPVLLQSAGEGTVGEGCSLGGTGAGEPLQRCCDGETLRLVFPKIL